MEKPSAEKAADKEISLWRTVLSQLRTNAFFLGPLMYDSDLSVTPGIEKSMLAEREYLLSQLDDALEISRAAEPIANEMREFSVGRLAEDFAEGYARRFGPGPSSLISMHVDPELPILRGSPNSIMRVVDALVRSAQRPPLNRKVEITLRASRNSTPYSSSCQLVIAARGAVSSAEVYQAQEAISEIYYGNYARVIQNAGLEFCAAIVAAKRLGGVARAYRDNVGTGWIEFRFDLEHASDTEGRISLPTELYAYAPSETLRDVLFRLCTFHRMQLIPLEKPSEAPRGQFYLHEALQINDRVLHQLGSLVAPERVVLVVSTTEVSTLRRLATMGFKHIVSVPLVSTKVLRAVNGQDPYQLPKHGLTSTGKRKLRVLIVDDVPTARIVLRDYLETEGHGVIEASDGAEFVLRIQKGEVFDLVFCDFTMGHMDGATAVKMVREHEQRAGKHMHIVLMTAYGVTEELQSMGFDQVLPKPIDVHQVANILDRLCSGESSVARWNQPLQIIDLKDLNHRCGGKRKTMIKVLESFIATSKEQLRALQNPALRADKLALSRTVHTVKGLLRDAGAANGAKSLESIERSLTDPGYKFDDDLSSVTQLIEASCQAAIAAKASLNVESSEELTIPTSKESRPEVPRKRQKTKT